MNTHQDSKQAVVRRAPQELYMAFTDLRNFRDFLPEEKRKDVEADFDTLRATVQGYSIGIRVAERNPYASIVLQDDGAPFPFRGCFHFDPADEGPDRTLFSISLDAELNFMMKMLLGKKLKEALDQVVDGLAAASEGRMPEGFHV